MLAVIIIIIFIIGVAFFAAQNTSAVTINILFYNMALPLYLVVLISILFGFIFAWLLNLMNAFTSLVALRGKDSVIKKEKKTNEELSSKVHDLEIEKTRLETEKKSSDQ